jgi:serine/threonine-protein kinase
MKKNYTISVSVAKFWKFYVPMACLLLSAGALTGAFIVDRMIMPHIIGISSRDILEVPQIVSMPSDEARQKLYDIGLRLQVTGEEYSAKAPRGTILTQQPEAGEKVKKGRHICVAVSAGSEVAQLPKVSELSERNARNALRDAGFENISSKKVYDEEVQADAVINLDPPSGVRISREVPVLIKISKGPKPTHVTMPNVIGEMLSDAKLQLEEVGLVSGKIDYRISGGSSSGIIISQSVPPGISVPLESAVDLVVAGSR